MGPFIVYGALYSVWGPLECMGPFRVYGALYIVWGPLESMGPFIVYGSLHSLWGPLHDTFLQWGVVSISPKHQAERPPLVGCPRLLMQYIRSYPPYWRLFLHWQPVDPPCRGDRDPLTTSLAIIILTETQRNNTVKATKRSFWYVRGVTFVLH